MSEHSEHRERRASRSGTVAYGLSMALLVLGSAFTGAILRPAVERWRAPALAGGALAAVRAHAAGDGRRGRGAARAERLGALAAIAPEGPAREKLLALWAEAALQARRLPDAARAEQLREALARDPSSAAMIRLRRVSLAATMGQPSHAAELAAPLLASGPPELADEARLRLTAAMKEDDVRAWIADPKPRDAEDARRAGLAALRVLGDAGAAERLLLEAERAGHTDASLRRALADAYARLGRPKDLARVLRSLLEVSSDAQERGQLALSLADALARVGDVRGALEAVAPVERSAEVPARLAARSARYEILRRAGRLEAALAAVKDPAERAFVALEIERDYDKAAGLYAAAARTRPDSVELAEGRREAERRRELGERRTLYLQVLAKDPQDGGTREKLLGVLAALGDAEGARRLIDETLGDTPPPDRLAAAALALAGAGLGREAARYLERAHAGEADPARRQQLLLSLADLYAGAREEESARRIFTSLATEGSTAELRDTAVARLAALSR